MLKVAGLHTYHGYLHVLNGIEFSLQTGEILAIVGSNGAGKSTLLGTIAGIYASQAGNIVFEGEDISRMRAEQVVAKGIALVPERRQIFDALSVKDNLILGSYHRFRRERRQVMRDYEKMLAFFPRLTSMLDRPGGLLSGGEQQMVAIARGLMANPKLIMLDEPSLGLAPLIVKNIMEILKQLKEEFGTTVILVEQNVKAALAIADHACVLERGHIVISGTAQEVADNPAVRDAYLGKGKRAI